MRAPDPPRLTGGQARQPPALLESFDATRSFSKVEAMPRPAVTIAARAARSAGNVILRYMNRIDGLKIVEKQRMDFASEVDRLAEAEIVKELRRAYPDHAILAEESGALGKNPMTWVIDPLDGTHNYLRGIPHFSVSIALLEKGVPVHAVVFDPLRDELYTASKGDGAYLNDRRIRVAKRENLGGAMIATGFPYRQREHLDAQLGMTRAMLGQAEDIRRSGSAALDLAYTAAGRYDGYFEIGLKPWDLGAGVSAGARSGRALLRFRRARRHTGQRQPRRRQHARGAGHAGCHRRAGHSGAAQGLIRSRTVRSALGTPQVVGTESSINPGPDGFGADRPAADPSRRAVPRILQTAYSWATGCRSSLRPAPGHPSICPSFDSHGRSMPPAHRATALRTRNAPMG